MNYEKNNLSGSGGWFRNLFCTSDELGEGDNAAGRDYNGDG